MEQLAVPIDQTPEYIYHLRGVVHPRPELRQKGYIFDQLTPSELERKKRCEKCSRVLAPKDRRKPNTGEPAATVLATTSNITPVLQSITTTGTIPETGNEDRSPSLKPDVASSDADEPSKSQNASANRCKYHPGQVSFKKWTCCNGHVMAPPCRSVKEHTPRQYPNGELEANWRFFRTPPAGVYTQKPAVAVAIDCEMGVAESGESELIRVSVVDYFTGIVLLDSLVWPDAKMAHYNTRFSGITRQVIQDARRRRTCIFGRKNARKAVWRYVGPETIVVGHATNSDLTALRWTHPVVIDTLLVEDAILRKERPKLEDEKREDGQDGDERGTSGKQMGSTISPESRGVGLSLKALTRDRLKREIQIHGRGHDSIEDALATRDLLHWHLINRVMER